MFAIFVTGGKQYKVQEGDVIFVEKLDVNDGDTVTFDTVLAADSDSGFSAGTPYIAGASIEASVIKNGKGKRFIFSNINLRKTKRKKSVTDSLIQSLK